MYSLYSCGQLHRFQLLQSTGLNCYPRQQAIRPHTFDITYKNTRYHPTPTPAKYQLSRHRNYKMYLAKRFRNAWQFQYSTDMVTFPVFQLPATCTTWRPDIRLYRLQCNCNVCQLFILTDLWTRLANREGLCKGAKGSALCCSTEGSQFLVSSLKMKNSLVYNKEVCKLPFNSLISFGNRTKLK